MFHSDDTREDLAMIKDICQKGRTTCHLRYFRDWLDFVSMAERVQVGCEGHKFNGMKCASLRNDDSNDWSGANSLTEAIQLAHHGWPEGRSMVLKLSGEICIDELLFHTTRLSYSMDVVGDEPDIDCFLQGVPENMATLQENISSGYGKILRFFLNRIVSCSVSANVIIRKGVALFSMIKAILMLGYTVEITLVVSSENNGCHYEVFIPVLHAGDPLNIDTLAFMFIHPAVLRRLYFAIAECESAEIRSLFGFIDDRGGYGYAVNPICIPEDVVLFDWDDGLLDSDSQIIPYITEVLQRVGINVSDS